MEEFEAMPRERQLFYMASEVIAQNSSSGLQNNTIGKGGGL
jgi:hypothetical protein